MSGLGFLLAVAPAEQTARLRELRALATLLLGSRHPATAALTLAIADITLAPAALAQLDALPALRRRRLLATFGSLIQ